MSGEGYAFAYWDRRKKAKLGVTTCFQQPCPACFNDWGVIHKVIPAPPPSPKRVKLGWFIPNSSALILTMRNAIADGKRVVVEVLPNGPVEFFAEDK